MTHNTQQFSPGSTELAPTVNLLDAREVFAAVAMQFAHLDLNSSFIIFGCGASLHGDSGVILSRMRLEECAEAELLAREIARLARNLQELGATHLALLATGTPTPGECGECSGARVECFDGHWRDMAETSQLIALCDLVAEACLMSGVTIPCALHAYEGLWAFSSTVDAEYWRVSHLGELEESAFAASVVASGIPFRSKIEKSSSHDVLIAAVKPLCDSDVAFPSLRCLESESREALGDLLTPHAFAGEGEQKLERGIAERYREAVLTLASLAVLGPGRDHIIASVIGLDEEEPLSPSYAIERVFDDPEFFPAAHLMPGGEGDRLINALAEIWRRSNGWDCSARYRAAFANLAAIAAFLLWFSGRMGEAYRLASDIIAVEDSSEMAELVVGLGAGGVSPLWLEEAYAPPSR
ncbi:hypothetical protein M3D48_04410 [Dermabacter vaginalis]|uniref:hypothetical protein n=1 Tax=Dermabacter vaginalis TaxID=1630135 RepID=UPI0021A8733F|nr:hypothetical protein [Dermabacter vaginalis]MCT2149866.1 hypothetical protein [Dermabacter vaginalis]